MHSKRIVGHGAARHECLQPPTATPVVLVFLPSFLHGKKHPLAWHDPDRFHIHGRAALVAAQIARDEVSAVAGEVEREGSTTTDNALSDARPLLAAEASHTCDHTGKDVALIVESAAKGVEAAVPESTHHHERPSRRECKPRIAHLMQAFTQSGLTTCNCQGLPGASLPMRPATGESLSARSVT